MCRAPAGGRASSRNTVSGEERETQSSSSSSAGREGKPSPGGPADPYRDWLGVKTVERAPSAYALLGLAELESNPKTIADAARQAKKTLRSYQIGPYRKEALRLMTEVGQAVDLLTSPGKKSAYDEERRRRLLELAQGNFPQAELQRPLDEVFAEWLVRCTRAGLPVPNLLPDLMQWCLSRSFSWPKRGPHGVVLPLGLWIYVEATVVGQCVARSPLGQRVRAVKRAQASFGISAQLSRIINLDIAHRPESFTDIEVVRLAAEQPRELMQRWVDLLAANDIVLDHECPAYKALAFLLGLVDADGRPIAEPVRPQVVKPREPSAAGAALASARDAVERTVAVIRRWAEANPQFTTSLKWALVISAGLLALLVILLLALGR